MSLKNKYSKLLKEKGKTGVSHRPPENIIVFEIREMIRDKAELTTTDTPLNMWRTTKDRRTNKDKRTRNKDRRTKVMLWRISIRQAFFPGLLMLHQLA